MSNVHATPVQAAQSDIAAALLAVGHRLDQASLMLTAGALLALVLVPLATWPRISLYLVILFGLAEHFFALRTTFDQRVFSAWSKRWKQNTNALENDLAAFDQTLAEGGLRPSTANTPRPLTDRITGARRLLRHQGLCLTMQLIPWLLASLLVIRESSIPKPC